MWCHPRLGLLSWEDGNKKKEKSNCNGRSELNHVRKGFSRDEDVSRHRVNGVGLLRSKKVMVRVRLRMRMRRNL